MTEIYIYIYIHLYTYIVCVFCVSDANTVLLVIEPFTNLFVQGSRERLWIKYISHRYLFEKKKKKKIEIVVWELTDR